jgi:hypothetical protein
MNAIAATVHAFLDLWEKGSLNGDEIYSLHYIEAGGVDREVALKVSELRQLLDERNYDRNLIGRLERAYPHIADELKLHAP